ncbi:Glycosyltransferase involved in cell wall bisynthesis [Roseateles sp. YR242]|uniref:glycosyltransferase family 2 protein n=1 Tax=Roseateles sp. YR242 TaxID=1855305 RepID=UPI0008C666EB|nr:glycosyltransferase family 2 protein [Roseateles sp. YR242]SEK52395.1 Glycosyltransferase involved in cell wall bisynthesis [Roseateles sp. YR242]
MSELPLVSVYMPTQNRLASMRAAVESVLGQTYRNVELVVVDDGSTDETPAYLTEMAQRDPRLKVLRHEKGKGACAARNEAIRASTGVFLTGLDDDDEFKPHHIEALLAYWQLLTSMGDDPSMLYVQYEFRSGDRAWYSAKVGRCTAEMMLDANHVGNQLFGPRERFISAGLFDEEMPAWQDLEFFYRILKLHGPARLLDLPTYVFDVSPRPDRISSKSKQKVLRACQLMFAKHGQNNGRVMQLMLLQVFSEYYGFRPDATDMRQFMKLGWWAEGWYQMVRRWLREPAKV